MKKLFILICIILPGIIYGQGMHSRRIAASGGGGYTTEYQAVLDAMTTDPTGDTLTWQNDLVYSLDTTSSGATSVFDRASLIYVFATPENGDGEALINWANPGTYNATEVANGGGLTHSINGLLGDSAAYLRTGWAPEAVNPAPADTFSFTFGFYESTSYNEGRSAFGTYDDNNTSAKIMMQVNDGGWFRGRINAANSQNTNSMSTPGMIMMTRRASNETEQYFNGISTGTDSDVSSALSAAELGIFCEYRGGGIWDEPLSTGGIYEGQLSFFIVLDAVTDEEAASINTIVTTYLTNIGVIE